MSLIIFLKDLFILERERECVHAHEQAGGGEAESDSLADSPLSWEPTTGLNAGLPGPWDHDPN